MTGARPPRWARRLVALLVTGRHREFVLGDLEEMYARRRGRGSRRAAVLAYLGWGLRSAPRAWASKVFAGAGGDLRAALRQFRSNPRVYIGGSAVLALGLGAGAVAWGIDYGAFGRGLPVSAPDRMVAIWMVETETRERRYDFSPADRELLAERVPVLDGVGLWTWADVTLAGGGAAPQRARATRASPSMFDLLELRPLHGRVLAAFDAEPDGPTAVVLGHRFWVRRYDADPDIVGRALDLDGRPAVVVGVLAPGERFVSEDLWIPIRDGRGATGRDYQMLARLTPGVAAEDLASALGGFGERLPPDGDGRPPEVRLEAAEWVASLRATSGTRYMAIVVWSGVLLFLMALANVANLFLVRARARTRELAVRRALGAGRLRIVRQLALEAAIPALLGFVGACAIAAVALDWYQGLREIYAGGPISSWQAYRLELPHVAVLAAGALLSTVVVSLVAGLREFGRDQPGTLRAGRGTTSRFRLGQGLVAVEVALGGALILLSALMIRSAWNLRSMDWGFETESVLTGHVILDDARYPTPDDRLRFWDAVSAELAAIPGVESTTLATQLPMIRYAGRWGAVRAVEVDGRDPVLDPADLPLHYVDAVTPTFFDTFESPVVAGRGFAPSDVAGAEPVALVNTHFARRFFPDRSAVGGRVRVWRDGEPGPWRTIVGIAPHLWMDTDENENPEGVYVPLAQTAPAEASLAIRVRGVPGDYAQALRDVVRRLDPDLPVADVRSMPELIRFRTRTYRVFGFPFIWVGLAALVLVVGGLYAVVSYIASLRTAEFGIRAALGATLPELVARSVLAGVPAIAIGLAAAIACGLALTRGFSRFMFEVDPWSPAVIAATFATLVLTTLLASLVPALRTGRRLDLVRILTTE
ncbi:MAG: ABC transporter permease [Gemmatimonadota bacterium]